MARIRRRRKYLGRARARSRPWMRKRSRSTYRRRSKRSRMSSIMTKRMGTLYPDRVFVKLRANLSGSLTCAAGSIVWVILQGNGLNNVIAGDTDVALLQFYTHLYNQWIVRGSKAKKILRARGPTQTYTLLLPSNTNSVVPTSWSQISSLKYASVKEIGGANVSWGPATEGTTTNSQVGYGPKAVQSRYMSTKKIMGIKNQDATLWGNWENNPADAWYWLSGVFVPNYDTQTTSILGVDYRMTYYVEFFKQRNIYDIPSGD